MTYRLTSDRAAAVSPTVHWIRITADTRPPSGCKLQLINQAAGVAVYSIYTAGSDWTHFCPLPTFAPDDKKD